MQWKAGKGLEPIINTYQDNCETAAVHSGYPHSSPGVFERDPLSRRRAVHDLLCSVLLCPDNNRSPFANCSEQFDADDLASFPGCLDDVSVLVVLLGCELEELHERLLRIFVRGQGILGHVPAGPSRRNGDKLQWFGRGLGGGARNQFMGGNAGWIIVREVDRIREGRG